MNSREKGKQGERELAAFLRENGFDARRGQQFSGGADSPDIVSELLKWLHIEVKRVERLNLIDACAQAEGDCAGKPWTVIHRRNHAPWLFTGRLEILLDLIRGVLPPGGQRCPRCGASSQDFLTAAGAAAINENPRDVVPTQEQKEQNI